MQLNHLPITFSTSLFEGFQVAYASSEQLRELRTDLFRTHFVWRAGDHILLFPYEAGTKSEGQARSFDTAKDFSVANALARQALLRSFFNHNRSISGVRPARFVRDIQNLLTGAGADVFAAFAEYAFDVRPLAPQDGAFINGVLVNFDALSRSSSQRPLNSWQAAWRSRACTWSAKARSTICTSCRCSTGASWGESSGSRAPKLY